MFTRLFSTLTILLITGYTTMAQEKLNYLALGDSYTIGEAVDYDKNWPSQLTKRLAQEGIGVAELKVIATTGWTTDELADAIDKEDLQKKYDLVSLLIGVNNQYRNYDIKQYEEEFEFLVQKAILFADGKPARVFVVSIPDYGVTPFGKEKEPQTIDREIRRYNELSQAICEDYNIAFVDIFGISKNAADDPLLITDDDLHPSAEMYSLWVDEILPVVKKLLTD
jgi:lysophospholipase L1-like esterase